MPAENHLFPFFSENRWRFTSGRLISGSKETTSFSLRRKKVVFDAGASSEVHGVGAKSPLVRDLRRLLAPAECFSGAGRRADLSFGLLFAPRRRAEGKSRAGKEPRTAKETYVASREAGRRWPAAGGALFTFTQNCGTHARRATKNARGECLWRFVDGGRWGTRTLDLPHVRRAL